MHTRPEFAPLSPDEAYDLVEGAVLATVVTAGADGFEVSHLPFVLHRSRGAHGTLVSHIAAASPHAPLIGDGRDTVAVFGGPQGYISSSWYPRAPRRDSAPTWNFAVVHCHGRPVPLDEPSTARHIAELVDRMERGRPDRWTMGELGAGGMERRLPHVVGFELPIARLEAKFKMGQDERLHDTAAAMEALDAGAPALAAAMRKHNAHRA